MFTLVETLEDLTFLNEELLIGDNVASTKHEQIYRANEDFIPWKDLNEYLIQLRKAESSLDHKELRNIFIQTVSGFKHDKKIQDVIYLEDKKSSL